MKDFIPCGPAKLIPWIETFCSTLADGGPASASNKASISRLLAGSKQLRRKTDIAKLALTSKKKEMTKRNRHLKTTLITLRTFLNDLKQNAAWGSEHVSMLQLHLLPGEPSATPEGRKINFGSAYFSGDDSLIMSWLKNFSEQLPVISLSLDVPVISFSILLSAIGQVLAQADKYKQAVIQLQNANTDKDTCEKDLAKSIRAIVNDLKSSPHWTKEHATSLKVNPLQVSRNLDDFKPAATLRTKDNHVRVIFSKGKADAINIYTRMEGKNVFDLLDSARRSPFRDPRPVTTHETSIREYQLRGVFDGNEVGQLSEVLCIRIAARKGAKRKPDAMQTTLDL